MGPSCASSSGSGSRNLPPRWPRPNITTRALVAERGDGIDVMIAHKIYHLMAPGPPTDSDGFGTSSVTSTGATHAPARVITVFGQPCPPRHHGSTTKSALGVPSFGSAWPGGPTGRILGIRPRVRRTHRPGACSYQYLIRRCGARVRRPGLPVRSQQACPCAATRRERLT